MTITFAVTETMRGVHHFVDSARGPAEDRPFHFCIEWSAPLARSLRPWSDEFMRYEAKGEIFAAGLTPRSTPCRGSLAIDYLADHTIRYDLEFEADGTTHRYEGTKTDVRLSRPLQLIKTHTTCYGRITDASGAIVSRSVLHFLPETTGAFLRSFRLRR